MQKQVSILGCGWLGLALADILIARGWHVLGSSVHLERKSFLKAHAVEPFYISCQEELRGERLDEFFSSPILILTIPFLREFVEPHIYFQQIAGVVSWVRMAGEKKKIIFCSSTSVYANNGVTVVETDPPDPQNKRAQILADVEQMVLTAENVEATVIRFAGLYGYDRNAARILTAKKVLTRPQAPLNVIHRDDCTQIIYEILQQEMFGEIFNACSDKHPTRQQFYSQCAAQLGLPLPKFLVSDTTREKYKIVSNEKLRSRLKYVFKYPDPLAFPY